MFVHIMQQSERDHSTLPKQAVNYTGICTMHKEHYMDDLLECRPQLFVQVWMSMSHVSQTQLLSMYAST